MPGSRVIGSGRKVSALSPANSSSDVSCPASCRFSGQNVSTRLGLRKDSIDHRAGYVSVPIERSVLRRDCVPSIRHHACPLHQLFESFDISSAAPDLSDKPSHGGIALIGLVLEFDFRHEIALCGWLCPHRLQGVRSRSVKHSGNLSFDIFLCLLGALRQRIGRGERNLIRLKVPKFLQGFFQFHPDINRNHGSHPVSCGLGLPW